MAALAYYTAGSRKLAPRGEMTDEPETMFPCDASSGGALARPARV